MVKIKSPLDDPYRMVCVHQFKRDADMELGIQGAYWGLRPVTDKGWGETGLDRENLRTCCTSFTVSANPLGSSEAKVPRYRSGALGRNIQAPVPLNLL